VRALQGDADRVIANVQADEPLIPPDAIRAVAQLLEARADCDIATCAHRLHLRDELFDPNVVKVVVDAAGTALLFSRAPIPWSRDEFAGAWSAPPGSQAQILPPEYLALRHVGLYAYRAEFLGRFSQFQPAPLEVAEKLEQLRALWHGSRIAVMTMDSPLPPGVDTPEDLTRVRSMLAHHSGA
jgi:3-deoxy-manno-octulosonate cytidylyltransferase (CMP-KDO synthetase)